MLDTNLPAMTMEDHLGIVYVIETAQQFWSELEDLLKMPSDNAPTLSLLDSTLRRFLTLCATYHEQYLQSPLQLEHAFNMLLSSELFQFHSERMCEIIVEEGLKTTDPHTLFVLYNTLYFHGRRRVESLRNQKRWQAVIPNLMDHILVDIDPDVEDSFGGAGSRNSVIATGSVPVPIEVKLRSLAVKLLYEVCKVQKMTTQDLRTFTDSFIDYLFDLVEQTKYMHDEAFNYSVIKLIVALNEQFMVTGLGGDTPEGSTNRIIRILHTPEDLCVQLLILKLIYILFTTKGLTEYFYTNDLCVLVDVFLRELSNLDERNESRPQIMALLESLISNASIREVNPTTKRLVERCLSGEWCVHLRGPTLEVPGSPQSDVSSIRSPPGQYHSISLTSSQLDVTTSKLRNMKFSKSVEHFGHHPEPSRVPPIPRSPLDQVRHPINSSTASLSTVPLSTPSLTKVVSPPMPRRRNTTADPDGPRAMSSDSGSSSSVTSLQGVAGATKPMPIPSNLGKDNVRHNSLGPISSSLSRDEPPRMRRPPPPPPQRRKPPAVPSSNGVTMQTIKSSESSPLSRAPMGF
ncbi:hypothetical protein BKA70DRAFT_1463680 [Coprinopsis sp. MPI-PUGE-AT-0042]|nr:hypothetical protein BKA70DRAFT_1463680 [Coprinopsis sp. MPI-PUGE-AT-0042]